MLDAEDSVCLLRDCDDGLGDTTSRHALHPVCPQEDQGSVWCQVAEKCQTALELYIKSDPYRETLRIHWW